MLRVTVSIFALLVGFSISCLAQEGHTHSKHNMILLGQGEIFASHIVYKVPHNYQVILSLNLSADDKEKYLSAKRDHPADKFIYLLDSMDIKDIATQKIISGPVFHVDSKGNKHEVISSMEITNENFRIIYFDELPLNLSSDSALFQTKVLSTKAQANGHTSLGRRSDGFGVTASGISANGKVAELFEEDCTLQRARDGALHQCKSQGFNSCRITNTEEFYCNPKTQLCHC